MADAAPRLGRLGWTVGGLLAATAPHMLHLQGWVTALALSFFGWRVLAEYRGWRLPGRLARSLITLAAAAAIVLGYRALTGLDAGTALLVLMASLKLLETRTPRDHVVLVFIGWFLCLATFLYKQDLATAAMVVPAVWLLAASLLNVSRTATDGPPLRPFRTTGAMLLKALPMALVMFLFFPRIAGHFWGVPSAERAVTGISEELSPGDYSELSVSDAVAFRVRFNGPLPPHRSRYWRGPVLTEFDGFTWSRGQTQAYARPPIEFLGQPVSYSVTLEPTGQRMLFALDMVESWPERVARLGPDYQLLTRLPIDAVMQYTARSYPAYRVGPQLTEAMRRLHLRLPADRNPRSRALAIGLRGKATDDADFVRIVLNKFRDEEFFYTLTPPRLERDSVDDFLFNTRRGFCGHFASSFTMLMRAAGVPARVVGGYQGGEWNPVGGYLIMRQSHAHAWSEVWLGDRGWVRVDPTAAVAPERVEQGLDAALPEDEPVAGRLLRRSDFLWQARFVLDNVNANWNDWVVKFSEERQARMLEGLGFGDTDWKFLAMLLGAGLAASFVLLSAWLAWEFRPPATDAATRSYRRFTARLARRGIERPGHETPRDYLQRVARLRPDLARQATGITELYLRLRYAPAPDPADLDRLRLLVRHFRP